MAVVTTASLTGAGVASAVAPLAQGSGPDVCSGVTGCRVVALADINGDGSRDAVGFARRGANFAPRGTVIVRVKTGPNRIVSVRKATEYWSGPAWNGVAKLDGRRGKDIVVGYTVGAHAMVYRALTWRQGDLATLDAPGRSRFWYVDGAYSVSAGWVRRAGDPPGRIRERIATRIPTPTSPDRWNGTVTTYQWSAAGWTRVRSRTIRPLAQSTAYSWAGFHVPGLKSGLG